MERHALKDASKGAPGTATRHAASERNKVHERVLDGLRGKFRAEMDDLQRVLGHTCVVEGEGEALCGERRLRGRLEDDSVAGDKRREDGVDHDKVWIAVAHHFQCWVCDQYMHRRTAGISLT